MKPRSGGFTLLELVVAVLVLSLGTLAATRATDQSRVAIGGAKARLLSQIVAANRAEELRIYADLGITLPNTVTQGGQVFTITTKDTVTAGGLARIEITARAQTGQGAVLVTYLPLLRGGS